MSTQRAKGEKSQGQYNIRSSTPDRIPSSCFFFQPLSVGFFHVDAQQTNLMRSDNWSSTLGTQVPKGRASLAMTAKTSKENFWGLLSLFSTRKVQTHSLVYTSLTWFRRAKPKPCPPKPSQHLRPTQVSGRPARPLKSIPISHIPDPTFSTSLSTPASALLYVTHPASTVPPAVS